MPNGMVVERLGPDFDEGSDAFLDTAAVMMNLDLVITIDSAVAHLAGSLGRPAWVLLAMIPHWAWMLDREDSPWYPTVRLFRQTRLGERGDVLQRVKSALSEFVASRAA